MVLYRNQPATIQNANETLRDTLKILKLKSAMLIFFCLTRQFPTYGSSPNIFTNVMASTTIVAQASIFASLFFELPRSGSHVWHGHQLEGMWSEY